MDSTVLTLKPEAYSSRKVYLRRCAESGWKGIETKVRHGANHDLMTKVRNGSVEPKGAAARYEAKIRTAIEIGADIVVHTEPNGPAYVYDGGPRCDKQTLMIGPVSEVELRELMEFIRASALPVHKAQLNPEEFQAYTKHRGTGRNEPCPCGSGKKFKRCCEVVQ